MPDTALHQSHFIRRKPCTDTNDLATFLGFAFHLKDRDVHGVWLQFSHDMSLLLHSLGSDILVNGSRGVGFESDSARNPQRIPNPYRHNAEYYGTTLL